MKRFLLVLTVAMLFLSLHAIGQTNYAADFSERLEKFTQASVEDCGTATPTSSAVIFMKSYDCLVRAKLGKKIFKFTLSTHNEDAYYYTGIVTDKVGSAHMFRYTNSELRIGNTPSFEVEDCDSACLANFIDGAIEMSNHLSTRLP